MKSRATSSLASTLAATLVLLAPAVLWGQKGKPVPPPPSMAVNVWLDNSAGNMIRADSDPLSPYDGQLSPHRRGDTNVYDYYLTLWFRYSASAPEINRSVMFDFGLPRYAVGDKLECYPTEDYKQDRGKFPYLFPVPTFLTTGATVGADEPVWLSFQTQYEWIKDEDGTWVRLDTFLDLGSYANGSVPFGAPPRYVDFVFYFRTPEFIGNDVYAYVAHNGPVNPATSYGTTRGLAEVTPAIGGGFLLKPVSEEALAGSTLPTVEYPGLTYEPPPGVSEANLTLKIPLGGSLGYKAWSAHCDVGAFHMPFGMVVRGQ